MKIFIIVKVSIGYHGNFVMKSEVYIQDSYLSSYFGL